MLFVYTDFDGKICHFCKLLANSAPTNNVQLCESLSCHALGVSHILLISVHLLFANVTITLAVAVSYLISGLRGICYLQTLLLRLL